MVVIPYTVILFNIIARLPTKVVTQCKIVCTDWLEVLSTQEFAKIHCAFMRSHVDQKIMLTGRQECVLHSLNPNCIDHIKYTNVHIPFNAKPRNLLFLSSLDGMLCVCLTNTYEMVVWNPIKCAYKKLSNSKSQGFYKTYSDAVGFFIDSSNDYKILHIKRRRGTMAIYMYSLESSSWMTCRFLKNRLYHDGSYNWSKGTLCGSGLYFMVCQWWLAGNAVILRFDVNSKVFSEICYPNALGEGIRGNLVSIRDELCVFLYNGFHARKLEFWKMKDDLWTRVFVFPHFVCIPFALVSSITYLNFDGTCAALTEWGELFKLDVRSNGVSLCCRQPFFQGLHGVIYTETIMSLGF